MPTYPAVLCHNRPIVPARFRNFWHSICLQHNAVYKITQEERGYVPRSSYEAHDPGRSESLPTAQEEVQERSLRVFSTISPEFLAEVSSVLAKSLDYETTLTAIARLAVTHLADWCSVDIVEDGTVRRLAVVHIEPEKAVLAQELHRLYPTDIQTTFGIANVLRSGQSQLIPEIPDEALAATISTLR